jgi:phospholipid/cholesterol/gamma-HCH transport system substrate-binding protein
MNRRRGQALRVGILMSGALALLMLGLMLIGQGRNLFQRRVGYSIHFARTTGLLVGAPVALTGVNVGSVVDIVFPDDPEAHYIGVEIEVARGVADRIREDTVAAIHTQGILGDKYVELSAGTPTAPVREPGTVIPQRDPVDYEAVLGRSGDIVTNIVELTASLRAILQAIDRGEGLLGAIVRDRERGELTFADIRQTLANIAETTGHVARVTAAVEDGEGFLGALVRDTERAEGIIMRLSRSADNLERFTRELVESEGLLPRLARDREFGNRVLDNIDTTTEDLAAITERVRRGEGTLGALINDPTLYNETTAFVRTTRKSWTYRLFRGMRGLWPFGGEGGTDAEDAGGGEGGVGGATAGGTTTDTRMHTPNGPEATP